MRLIANDSAICASDWVQDNVPDSVAIALYAAFVRAKRGPTRLGARATK